MSVLDHTGQYWGVLGISGLFWAVLGSTWLIGTVMGFEKMYVLFGLKHHICIKEKIRDVTPLIQERTEEENGK